MIDQLTVLQWALLALTITMALFFIMMLHTLMAAPIPGELADPCRNPENFVQEHIYNQ